MANILILEDNETLLSTTLPYLRAESNHIFEVAKNVTIAMDALASKDFQILICDLDIKNEMLQGEHLIRDVAEKYPGIGILIVTGVHYRAKHFEKEGTFFENQRIIKQLLKPIDYSVLLEEIEKALEKIKR